MAGAAVALGRVRFSIIVMGSVMTQGCFVGCCLGPPYTGNPGRWD